MFIYVITNKVNGKQYVGQTIHPRIRWGVHRSAHRSQDSVLYRAMRKHGVENFTFEIVLCVLRREWMDQCEIEMIKELDTFNNGYNATLGGGGISGCKCTPERSRRISESNTGKKRSPESIERIRAAVTGRIKPEHVKEILRIKMTGRFVSAETRAKISKIHKGKKLSEEQKENLRRLWTGCTLSESTKRKIGDAHRGKKRSFETRKKLAEKAKLREQKKRAVGYRVPLELRQRISISLKLALAAKRLIKTSAMGQKSIFDEN